MQIACDHCGAEIRKEEALTREDEDDQVWYFCSPECMEDMEYAPGREDDPDEAS